MLYSPPSAAPWWASLRNATVLVTRMGRECRQLVPRRYRFAYPELVYDADVWAVPPLHWILRAWHWWRGVRYAIERRLIGSGILLPRGPEGCMLADYYIRDVPADPRDRTPERLVQLALEHRRWSLSRTT